ncbi:endo-1,3-beta-glucanase [Scheffersomyces amazonensis]|uniref:endo-1,3-beta-glucanase n=1 Tax=Scheffersomyces amazonensis TaxID=1078765 RepID=UPI00315DEA1A
MIYAYPYILFWKTVDYYGFGLYHTNDSDRVYASVDTNNVGVDSYFFNPVGNAEIIFSATSFSSTANNVSVSNTESMSVLINLSATPGDTVNTIEIPIVEGMGFATAIYHGDLVPLLNTLIGFSTFTEELSSALPTNLQKYRVTLFNGIEWLVYVTVPEGSDFTLVSEDQFHVQGSGSADGVIVQAAVAPSERSLETYYDQAAGQYAVSATVQGSVECTDATYSFLYNTEGTSLSNSPLIFALPHQVASLAPVTQNAATGITIASSSKGTMSGYLTNELVLQETLENNIGWLPWVQGMSSVPLTYTADQLALLASTANDELNVNIAETVANQDSMYYSGKAIDKYAYILLVVSEILGDEAVANATLQSLKSAFQPFLENTEYYPLMYDTKFLGVTSTANNDGDTGADFGAGYYNDHHFHYGYFVHAAAVVGYIDKKFGGTWAEDNKDWVNSLVRDVANPSADDSYFPISRMFDWFGGHSWAAGLFASGDGKNEESSSEDFNFAYGMKMWGNVIGDQSMEARGSLMLAITSRALNMYFYYTTTNTVEPQQILPNKISGIFFENKIDYTTYFGAPNTHPEYVHGIHMLPITPASSLVRIPSYVSEEWADQISTFIDNVDSGWTGILYLNEALFNAASSYSFFSSSDWSDNYLDGGQSRTWSLAFSGGVSNAN